MVEGYGHTFSYGSIADTNSLKFELLLPWPPIPLLYCLNRSSAKTCIHAVYF